MTIIYPHSLTWKCICFCLLMTLQCMYVFAQTDPRRRNSFKNQPELCKWNLLTLAEAIQDVLPLYKSRTLLEDL